MTKLNAPGLAGREDPIERARRLAGLPVVVHRLSSLSRWERFKASWVRRGHGGKPPSSSHPTRNDS